jgi:hypothetical protein
MSSWIESLLDVEDMRRRCVAHAKWMAEDPEGVVAAYERRGSRNQRRTISRSQLANAQPTVEEPGILTVAPDVAYAYDK